MSDRTVHDPSQSIVESLELPRRQMTVQKYCDVLCRE